MIKKTFKNFWFFGLLITSGCCVLYAIAFCFDLELGLELSIIALIINLIFLEASHAETIRQLALPRWHSCIYQPSSEGAYKIMLESGEITTRFYSNTGYWDNYLPKPLDQFFGVRQ